MLPAGFWHEGKFYEDSIPVLRQQIYVWLLKVEAAINSRKTPICHIISIFCLVLLVQLIFTKKYVIQCPSYVSSKNCSNYSTQTINNLTPLLLIHGKHTTSIHKQHRSDLTLTYRWIQAFGETIPTFKYFHISLSHWIWHSMLDNRQLHSHTYWSSPPQKSQWITFVYCITSAFTTWFD